MLLLIGGGSSVGKTVAAQALAAGLNINHIEIDSLLTASEFDGLFNTSAPGFWAQTPQELMQLLVAKGEMVETKLAVWLGLHSDERGVLLEGEGIQPKSHTELMDLPGIRLAFIVETESETLRSTLEENSKSFRGLTKVQQDILVKTNRLYNEWIAQQASHYQQPCVPSRPRSSLPARLLRAL